MPWHASLSRWSTITSTVAESVGSAGPTRRFLYPPYVTYDMHTVIILYICIFCIRKQANARRTNSERKPKRRLTGPKLRGRDCKTHKNAYYESNEPKDANCLAQHLRKPSLLGERVGSFKVRWSGRPQVTTPGNSLGDYACELQSIPGLFSTPTQMKRPGYEASRHSCFLATQNGYVSHIFINVGMCT